MQWQSASEKLICEKLLDILEITPFQTIKVTEFVRFAGISRSCFYLYFDSIYSVVQKLEDDFIEGLTEENQVIIPLIALTQEPLKKWSIFVKIYGLFVF